MLNVNSLAAFKRFLALPGATVQVVRNDWVTKSKAGYFEPKRVKTLQTNAVEFANDQTSGWLTFPKASNVSFENDLVVIDLNNDGKFSALLVYQLSLQEVL